MPRAHVTGATGFIGRNLIDHLRRAGWEVTAACRQPTRLGAGVDVVSMETECAPGAIVFHLAGRAHRTVTAEDLAAYQADNRDLAVAAFRLAMRGDASGFVFVSTARVLGESSARPLDESAVPHARGAYAQSKLEAETELRSLHEGTGLPLAIVRPPLVYGPGVMANFLTLMRWIRNGWPLPVGGAGSPRSMTYVGNLADLLETIGRRVEGVHCWHVRDDEDLSLRDLTALLGEVMRVRPRVVTLPRGIVEWAGRLSGRPQLGSQIFDPFVLDDRATRAALGWQPATTVREAVQQTVQWFDSP